MRPAISTWVVHSDAGYPLSVKAKCGVMTIGFPYDNSLSISSNHKAAALEMALVMGFTVSDAQRLAMVQTALGFEHRIAPFGSPKVTFLQKSDRGD